MSHLFCEFLIHKFDKQLLTIVTVFSKLVLKVQGNGTLLQNAHWAQDVQNS